MSNINDYLIDDGKGGKNIKYNDMMAPILGDKALLLGACRASFSAGGVVNEYFEKGEYTEKEREIIEGLENVDLKKRMFTVKSISEIFRSIVISFTSDKKFVICVHYTQLGAEYMTKKTGIPHVVDTEYYQEGGFQISLTPIGETTDYDCGITLLDNSLSCVLSSKTGLVTIKNFIFKEIPTVIIDEKPNATGGFDFNPDTLVYNGEIMRNIRYGNKVMHKVEPCDTTYEAHKAESEEQRTMRQTLDLYLPEDVKAHEVNCLVLCIHGGAWTGGDKSAYDAACKYYASLGYFAATINHTYVGRRYEDGKRVVLYDLLNEIDMAFAKIKELSNQNGWNIKKAATTGYSSGSQLSAWYAYALGHRKDAPIEVVFTFSMVGPMSFHLDCWDGFRTPIGPQLAALFLDDAKLFVVPESGEKKTRFEAMISNQISRDEIDEYDYTEYDCKTFDEKIDGISPLSYVKKGEGVPTILAEAAQDNSLISRRHGECMKEALSAAGIEHKVIIFPNTDHMGAGNAECGNVYRKYQKMYFKKYFGF